METLYSIFFYVIIFSSILIIIFKNFNYYRIIVTALLIRFISILFNVSTLSLPDSSGDALNFENYAWLLASSGYGNVVSEIINNSHGYSWAYATFMSFIYLFVGRDYLLILTINLLISALIFHFLIKISRELNYSNLSCKILLIIYSFFPAFINYASVSLREVYIHLLIVIIILYLIKWIRKFDIKYFLLLCFLFYLNNFLHEGVFIGILLLIFIQIINLFIKIINIKFNSIIIAASIFLSIFIFYERIPYADMLSKNSSKAFQGIPQCERVTGCENDNQSFLTALEYKTKITHAGSTLYPDYLIPGSPIEVLYLIPFRAIYFYIGPFIWDTKKIIHFYLFTDALIYLFFLLLIIFNYKLIIKDKFLIILLMFFILYSIIFSFGTSNYGSSYRHRAKFAVFLIIFVTPIIEYYFNIILSKKKNH